MNFQEEKKEQKSNDFNIDECLRFVLQKIEQTPVLTSPFPHLLIESIFPESLYTSLLDEVQHLKSWDVFHKPSRKKGDACKRKEICICDDALQPNQNNKHSAKGLVCFLFGLFSLSTTLKTTKIHFQEQSQKSSMFDTKAQQTSEANFKTEIQNLPAWSIVRQILVSDELRKALLGRFEAFQKNRYSKQSITDLRRHIQLNCDSSDFYMAPHTDTETKLIFGIVYLAKDKSQPHLSTNLFRHKKNLTSWPTVPKGVKINEHDFEKVKSISYLPNQMVMFLKSDSSWHGVEIKNAIGERHTIYYSVYEPHVFPKEMNEQSSNEHTRKKELF